MDEDLRQKIALFRFSLIAPILNNTFQNQTVKEYLQEICAKLFFAIAKCNKMQSFFVTPLHTIFLF